MGLDVRDLSRLGQRAQEQVLQKLMESQGQRENKYHNEQTVVRGISFDSKKEANRYVELMRMVKTGRIRKLKLQQDFTLQEGYTTPDGERVRPIKYRADFTYERMAMDGNGTTHWVFEVEDVKGVRTEKYKLKKKMMLERFGITIKEV